MREIEKFEEYLRYEMCRSPHTIRAYMADISAFALWSTAGTDRNFNPLDITTTEIRGWLGQLSREGEKPTSVSRRLQSLRSFFHFLCRHKLRKDNPAADIPSIKRPRQLPEFIRVEEMENLLTEKKETDQIFATDQNSENSKPDNQSKALERMRDALIIEILYSTGMRRAEILAIDDTDINHDRLEVKVTGKRRKQRVLPLPASLLERIEHWQQARDKAYPELIHPAPLFATSRGRMSESTLYRIVRRSLNDLNAGRKSPHTLRHTFATAMLNHGADIGDVKEFLGHSSLSTTQIYTHVSFADMMKAYESAHPRGERKKR